MSRNLLLGMILSLDSLLFGMFGTNIYDYTFESVAISCYVSINVRMSVKKCDRAKARYWERGEIPSRVPRCPCEPQLTARQLALDI